MEKTAIEAVSRNGFMVDSFFCDGIEIVEDDPCSGRSSTNQTPDNIEHMQQMQA